VEKPEQDEIERLILELKDDRRDVRSRAAYELGKHNDPRTLAPLIAVLSDNDKFVRSWAAGALAKAGPPAIPPLVEALGVADPAVGYYAALALGELGDLRAIPLLAQALREGDWDIRPSAACALAGLGDSATLPDRVLTEEGLTGADRASILIALREVAYTDDQVQIHISIPDVTEFCRQRSQSVDDAIRMGAVETLQAMESGTPPTARPATEFAAEPAEPTGPSTAAPTPQPSAEPNTWVSAYRPAAESTSPASTPAVQPAEAKPTAATPDQEKPKRSLWERLTGR